MQFPNSNFFIFDFQPYCKADYFNTLEKCCKCMEPILDRILRATGKPYHPTVSFHKIEQKYFFKQPFLSIFSASLALCATSLQTEFRSLWTPQTKYIALKIFTKGLRQSAPFVEILSWLKKVNQKCVEWWPQIAVFTFIASNAKIVAFY